MSNIHSDFILAIPLASIVPFPHPNPDWSSASTYAVFFSVRLFKYPHCYLCLHVRWSLIL